MSAITWLEVEGVRYEGLEDTILCRTAIGFHSQLPGHSLENLEVSDSQGRSLGFLSVIFDSGEMVLSPLVAHRELTGTELVLGDRQGVHILGLDELPLAMAGDTALLDAEPELMYPDSFSGYVHAPVGAALPLDCLVSSADETLDAFFGESALPAILPIAGMDELSVSLSTLYLEHGTEPGLMPMLPEPIDLPHII